MRRKRKFRLDGQQVGKVLIFNMILITFLLYRLWFFFRCWRTEFNEKQKKTWSFVPYTQWPQLSLIHSNSQFFRCDFNKIHLICKKGIKESTVSGRCAMTIANGNVWEFLILPTSQYWIHISLDICWRNVTQIKQFSHQYSKLNDSLFELCFFSKNLH